jgi:2-amino-4-hydroxy-6-hydroxymethyldihydropteridine diphosphokinase
MVEVYLSLGSNVGDRRGSIDNAVLRLAQLPGTKVTARSSYYRTAPVGPIAQEWFLNIAIGLETTLTLPALRETCHAIETVLGRDRAVEIAWGPRTIDIDIVYGLGEEPAHPEILQGYVLAPLAEIAGDVTIADRTLADLAREADLSGVERLNWVVPRN